MSFHQARPHIRLSEIDFGPFQNPSLNSLDFYNPFKRRGSCQESRIYLRNARCRLWKRDKPKLPSEPMSERELASGPMRGRRTNAKPEALVTRVPPDAAHLAFLREAPHRLHIVRDPRTTHVAHAVARVSIPSKRGAPQIWRSVGYVEKTAHPVAKMTTSASSVVPSTNASPFPVKRAIALPFLTLTSPSMMCLLVPTSVPKDV